MGMHNKGTYTRVLTYACVYAYRHTHIRKIRAYNTRMHSSDISELHCIFQEENIGRKIGKMKNEGRQ